MGPTQWAFKSSPDSNVRRPRPQRAGALHSAKAGAAPVMDDGSSLRSFPKGLLRRAKAVPALACIFAAAAANRTRGKSDRPEILIHAGEHKTGTTSVQSILLSQREAFARQGFHVLRAGQGTDGAHHRLIYMLLGQSHSRTTRALLGAELAQAKARTVLISSETVKKAVVEGKGDSLIDALRAAGAARVRLLLYVRSPFGLANSAYSSHTSRLELEGATFAEFVRTHEIGPAYRYDRFLELARRDDVDLVVRPYSASARRSIARDFAEALGIELGCGNEPRHNMSFGPVGLEALRVIAAEAGPLSGNLRKRLYMALRPIARSLGEQPFWGVDEPGEAALATADRRTEEFARALWGRGWREVIGEERRGLNLFDPADPDQQRLLETALRDMRRECERTLR